MHFGATGRAIAASGLDGMRDRRLGWLQERLQQRLRMHHVLFVAFTLIAAIPVFSLAAWVEHRAVQQEINLANDKHLLVARNLTSAFSRYVFDVKAGFRLAIATFNSGETAPGLQDLLTSLEFRHISVVDANTGEVERYMPGFAGGASAPSRIRPELLAKSRDQLKGGEIVITNLQRDLAGKPAFFVLKALPDDRIAYGVIGTNYLVDLQRKIAFGARGHAAVLDATGRVIAHPFQKWVDDELDLSKTPPAKAIMAGQSGVMQFFSPAFKADMITAYTPVPETGWGVMVPQPMEELYAQADEVSRAATAIAFLGLIAAGLMSWSLAKYISRPLKAITNTATAIAAGDPATRAPTFSAGVPRELHLLSASFNQMLDELRHKNNELTATAVRAQAANRAKSEFLANMSHELRTPLNAILGFSEIMRDEVFGPVGNARYADYAGDINSSATHLIGVIADILDLSKAEAGHIQVDRRPAEIAQLIDGSVRLVGKSAADRKLQLVQEIAPALRHSLLDTDPGKLTQVLVNLLSNSVKFTEAGGTITIGARLAAETVEFWVRDTGIGIASEHIDIVMTPFGQVTTPYQAHEGFGLGLPLSKKLTEALGGSMSLDSELDRGTTITLSFPAADLRVPEQELAA